MEIILATQNDGKIKEFNELAEGTELDFIALPDKNSFPEETGNTFFENAFIKANFAFSLTGLPCLGDDSGLEVDFLDGKPGIYSSRYSKRGTDQSNIDKLLFELKGVPDRKRSARFRCCLVLILANKDHLQIPLPSDVTSTQGIVEGKIGVELRGDMGFGYDPIFIPDGSLLHMAEIDQKKKNLMSHRANAFKSLLTKLPSDLTKK